jgi:hypothetical protein
MLNSIVRRYLWARTANIRDTSLRSCPNQMGRAMSEPHTFSSANRLPHASPEDRALRAIITILKRSHLDFFERTQIANIAAAYLLGEALEWDKEALDAYAKTGAEEHFRTCLVSARSVSRAALDLSSSAAIH